MENEYPHLEPSLLPDALPDINYLCQSYLPDCHQSNPENFGYHDTARLSSPLPPSCNYAQEVNFDPGASCLPTPGQPWEITNFHPAYDKTNHQVPTPVTASTTTSNEWEMFTQTQFICGEDETGGGRGALRGEEMEEDTQFFPQDDLFSCANSSSSSSGTFSSHYFPKKEKEKMELNDVLKNLTETDLYEQYMPFIWAEESCELKEENEDKNEENIDDEEEEEEEERENNEDRYVIETAHDSLKKIKSNTRKRERGPKSWEFLMRLLADPQHNPRIIRWENEATATFRLTQPDEIAALWSSRSSRHTELCYNNFARCLRHHYTTGALEPVMEMQLVYRCGPRALAYLTDWKQEQQQLQQLSISSPPPAAVTSLSSSSIASSSKRYRRRKNR